MPPTVRQGEVVQTADGSQCTLGYVETTRAWTAAHCGVNGQAVYLGDGRHLGTLRYYQRSGANGHDLAYIQFADGTHNAGNPISGEGISAPPATGEQVCVAGRRSPVNCGIVKPRPLANPGMYASSELFKLHGDSGAGVYSPGRPGVVGIYTGTAYLTADGKTEVFEDIAAMPSPADIAALPYQGFVPRKPAIQREVRLEQLPAAFGRQFAEVIEAVILLIQRGFTFSDMLGLLGALGVFF